MLKSKKTSIDLFIQFIIKHNYQGEVFYQHQTLHRNNQLLMMQMKTKSNIFGSDHAQFIILATLISFMMHAKIKLQVKRMQRKTINLFVQPTNQSNGKTNSNLQSPNKTFIHRKNLNLNSFKKASTQKSSEQKQTYHQFKYTLPNKVEATERSLLRSQNNSGLLFVKGHFQDISATINRSKNQSKQLKNDKESKAAQKANSTKTFDEIFSGLSQRKSKDQSDEYYLYWKGKAHEYLQANMKMMEEIRKLTRENEQLKERISLQEEKALANLNKEAKRSQSFKQSLSKQQNKSNGYLIQKLEELQRELKKKEIVVKSYEEKIIQLNSRIVGDNQRAKLINKLKSQIDSLKNQLNGESSTKVSCLRSLESQESSIQEKQRSMIGRGYFKGSSTFERW